MARRRKRRQRRKQAAARHKLPDNIAPTLAPDGHDIAKLDKRVHEGPITKSADVRPARSLLDRWRRHGPERAAGRAHFTGREQKHVRRLIARHAAGRRQRPEAGRAQPRADTKNAQ